MLHTDGVKSQILGQRRQEGAHREPSLSGTQSYPYWHLGQLSERLAVLDTWQQLDALIRMWFNKLNNTQLTKTTTSPYIEEHQVYVTKSREAMW